ncbi:MAG: DUF4129 domain-containing protein [Gemmatimonadales bacterium]
MQAPDGVVPDSLRRVVADVFRGAAYQWQDESSATVTLRRWRRAVVDWFYDLAESHPAAFKAIIYLLVAVLAAIALHAVWLLIRTTRARAVPAGAATARGRAEVRDAGWFAALAARHRAAGRFAAAMQAEFVRLVLELDTRGRLRFHPSRTPQEYLADFPAADPQRGPFAELVRDLYRFAFGGTPCGAAELDDWTARAAAEHYVPGP